jgi:GLPGLI family protein
MKKLIILILFLSFEGYSQEFLGKAYYMSKSTVNMDWMNNMSPERAKYIKARMKTALEKNYILDFDSKSSYFKEEVTLDAGGSGGGGFNWMQFVVGPDQGDIYKDVQEKMYINKRELFGKVFLIKDNIEPTKWVMTGESKKIGQYNAFKATYTKEVEEQVFSFSRRQQQNNDQENNNPAQPKTKLVTMTAWFTPEIPVSTGPAMYGGLPGLILEISDGNRTMLCTKVVINPKEKIKIKEPSKGKIVSNLEFKKIQEDKMKEMRERYNRGGGRGGWGSRSTRVN